MSNGVDRKIHVEIRPVEVMGLRPFHSYDFCDRGIFKPGKVLERHKQFLIGQKQPEAMLRDVGYLASEVCLPSAADFIFMLLD